MFKTAIKLCTIILLAGAMQSVRAGVAGSPHDLTLKYTGAGATTETCKYCHTPHSAQTTVVGAPLWNHGLSTVSSYTMYSSASSSTFNGGTATEPGPTSKLCLSCHDGTMALDSFATAGVLSPGVASHTIVSTALVGKVNVAKTANDLQGEHPIGFTYATSSGGDSSIKASPDSRLPLFAGKMECASCHAVHDNTIKGFLRIDNAGSAMCIGCHTK